MLIGPALKSYISWSSNVGPIEGLFSGDLVCKEELNLMLKVLRLLIKVRWVELGGTDSLSTKY